MNFAQSKHKAAALATALAVVVSPSLIAQPAQAVTNYTVTIVSTGGAAENSNWTFANGEITPQASVSINASDVVAKLALGDLVLNGDKILVNAGINSPAASDLTFKSTGNIIVAGAQTLQTLGGDIVFNADSDANLTGHVRLGWDSNCGMGYVNTNGGNIIIGGGANPLTDVTSAQNADLPSTLCPGGTPALTGTAVYNYSFNAAGGNISLRGGSQALGTGVSVRSLRISGSGGLTPTLQTSGSGTINVYGDGSLINHNNAWGVELGTVNMTTASGAIVVEGRGNPASPTNARGVAIGGVGTFTSVTGDISLLDRTNGALAGYTGIYMGGAINATTQGDFTIQADELVFATTLTVAAQNAAITANSGSSFTATYTTGTINASGTQNLSIGAPGNTAAINFNAPVISGGPIAVYGGAIAVNASMTATSAPITFTASTSVTQGGSATITASSLDLRGTATYNPSAFTVTGGAAQVAYYATFDTQGGSAVATGTYGSGGTLALPAAPTKAGFVFRGWFLAASGGDPLQAPYSPAANADFTLYAQWSPAVPPKDYPEVQQVKVAPVAEQGKPIVITIAGDKMDLPLKVEASNGTAVVTSRNAGSIEVTITGATPGKGSLLIQGASRSLQLADLYSVTAPKPVVSLPVYKEADVVFDAGSTRLTPSDISAIRASIAGSKVVGEVTVAAWLVAAKPTAADRATARARAKAVATAIAKVLPGVRVSITTVAVPRFASAKDVVTYSFTAKP